MNGIVFRILLVVALAAGAVVIVSGGNERPKGSPLPDSLLWEEAVGPYLPSTPELVARGKAIYEEQCEMCHGWRGEGDGAGAYFLKTKPRNFATRTFKFRTTVDGMPADQDLFRSVTVGFQAYGMPPFRSLPIRDRWAVVHYVKKLAEDGTRRMLEKNAADDDEEFDPRQLARLMRPGEPLALPPETPPQEGDRELGRTLYKKNCAMCHGPEGRGDGNAATDAMKDRWGNVIRPRDFRAGRQFRKSGWRTRDTARVIVLGIGGTPMPKTELKDARELWALARYVQFLSGEE